MLSWDFLYRYSHYFGLSADGGRTIWENAWRACIERVHGQKSLLVGPETPLQSRIGISPDFMLLNYFLLILLSINVVP